MVLNLYRATCTPSLLLMSFIITATDLNKNYSGENALAGVTFNVEPGRLFGLIGADGAGKTTLLRVLTTLCDVDKGNATVLGMDVMKDFRRLRSKIGYMPQKFSLYQDLSVRENLLFFADIFGVKGKTRSAHIERLLSFSRLGPFQNRRSHDLSGGMKQKLALSCTLIHTPEIVFLDEPTTGVDPVSRNEFWDILFDLKHQGITVVVSTPYMDEAQQCDELLFLHQGAIIRQGKPETLLADYPFGLFSVEGKQDAGLFYPQKGTIPDQIALIYPCEGTLHVAARNRNANDETVLSLVKTVLPEASVVKKILPKIEDLFVYLLSDSQ
jgi:ABC-2 type transport system ATP-binding protein